MPLHRGLIASFYKYGNTQFTMPNRNRLDERVQNSNNGGERPKEMPMDYKSIRRFVPDRAAGTAKIVAGALAVSA